VCSRQPFSTLCCYRADCPDFDCPGRTLAALHEREGGHDVVREISVRIEPPRRPQAETTPWSLVFQVFVGVFITCSYGALALYAHWLAKGSP